MAKSKRYKRRKWLLIIEILLILVAIYLGIVSIAYSKLNKSDWSDDDIYTNEYTDSNIDKYTNIALFGVDSRENDLTKNTRSDSIIIASINKLTHKLKLVSVYRDTLCYIPDHGYTKINHSYAYGGPKLAIETLNRNFDLNITDYITVNFSALTDVVDALGGISIDITEDELKEVNRYAKDVARINNKEWTPIESAGSNVLTGVQATGYSRVRYTSGGDFTRAQRQRTVINAIIDKAKKSSPAALMDVVNNVLPEVSTSLGPVEFAGLVSFLPFYNTDEQAGFPFDKKTGTVNKASVVIATTMESNVKELHSYLFGTEDYSLSETAKKIHNDMGGYY